MCLVLVAIDPSAEYPLVIAANRDERHDRPAEPLHWWPDRPSTLAGRDRRAGGTWMGVHASGRFATVLNDRRWPAPAKAPSRGGLVTGYLASADPRGWLESLAVSRAAYAGFHLLAGSPDDVHYLSSGTEGAVPLGRGLHVVDNAGLDVDDPRGRRARERIAPLLSRGHSASALLDALGDTGATDGGLGDRRPVFIADADFGTRCSTVLRLDAHGGGECVERRFDAGGAAIGESAFSWRATADGSGAC